MTNAKGCETPVLTLCDFRDYTRYFVWLSGGHLHVRSRSYSGIESNGLEGLHNFNVGFESSNTEAIALTVTHPTTDPWNPNNGGGQKINCLHL